MKLINETGKILIFSVGMDTNAEPTIHKAVLNPGEEGIIPDENVLVIHRGDEQ